MAEYKGASPNSQFLVGELPHGQTQTKWWEGTGASIAAHVVLLGVLIYSATHVSQIAKAVTDTTQLTIPVLFKNDPGPGGGGGGRKDPAPPKKAEIVAAKPVAVATPIPKPADVPTPPVIAPIQTVNAVETVPGSMSALDMPVGTGGSNGRGTGIGNGTGNGVGDGTGGGFGGGAYQIGNGVTSPTLIREVKPNYTGDAMRAKLQGVVEMECIVLPDGTVDPKSIKITRSLDSTFGLDQQAIIAVKQWRFRPGTLKGQPVPVIVNVELTFTLR
jgi:protein TonB